MPRPLQHKLPGWRAVCPVVARSPVEPPRATHLSKLLRSVLRGRALGGKEFPAPFRRYAHTFLPIHFLPCSTTRSRSRSSSEVRNLGQGLLIPPPVCAVPPSRIETPERTTTVAPCRTRAISKEITAADRARPPFSHLSRREGRLRFRCPGSAASAAVPPEVTGRTRGQGGERRRWQRRRRIPRSYPYA